MLAGAVIVLAGACIALACFRVAVEWLLAVRHERGESSLRSEWGESERQFSAGRLSQLAEHRRQLQQAPPALLGWLWLASTSPEQLEAAERLLLLSCLGAPTSYTSTMVPCGDGLLMNTLLLLPPAEQRVAVVQPVAEPAAAPLVLAHGFGGGLGIFVKTLQVLHDERQRRRIYAIDWLGMGRSSRPPWREPGRRWCGADEDADRRRRYAEEFFVEALEHWRRSLGLAKMVLVGHSVGGYLMAAYALRYPDAVERLILVSPAGTTPAPDGLEAKGRRLYRWVRVVWRLRVVPQSLLRLAGPWARHLMWRLVQWRGLKLQPGAETRAFANYLYHVSVARSSGENCLYSLLDVGAYARCPLDARLPALPDRLRVDFIYGNYDWMDRAGAAQLCRDYPARFHMHTVFGGHHLYLDSPHEFADVIDQLLNKCR